MARELKSGLGLAAKMTVRVQENQQRPKIAFWISVPSQQANGKNGVNGPNARLLVAREPKSGLGHAAKETGRVQGNQQRPKIVLWLNVQVFPSA